MHNNAAPDSPNEEALPDSAWPTWAQQTASLRNHPEWVRQLQAEAQQDRLTELTSLN
mgnify:CR=1 FL=1